MFGHFHDHFIEMNRNIHTLHISTETYLSNEKESFGIYFTKMDLQRILELCINQIPFFGIYRCYTIKPFILWLIVVFNAYIRYFQCMVTLYSLNSLHIMDEAIYTLHSVDGMNQKNHISHRIQR